MVQLEKLTAFIPAAGYGRRMGKRCTNYQKCMLPIFENKMPILFHIIDNLRQLGVKNFIIAVNHCKNQIIDFFGDGREFGITIQYTEGDFHSTYDTLMKSIDLLPDIFIYTHGDMIFNKSVYTMLEEKFNTNEMSTLALMHNTGINMTHPQLIIENGIVKKIFFNAEVGEYPYMYLGGAIYNKSDFLENFNGDFSGMVEKVVMQKLNKSEIVNAVIYDGKWRHLMNEDDFQLATNEKNWLESE